MEIEFEHGTLFYDKKQGTDGQRVLLLFPGVGQDHTIFTSVVKNLGGRRTAYSFDLFLHGRSRWSDPDRPLQKAEWKKIVGEFLSRENITRFDVLGYSIGGRLALATLEAFPDRVNSLYMVAGEGLRKNFWYEWATHPAFGKPLFKKMMASPTFLVSVITLARSLSLIPIATSTLALAQLQLPETRQKVYGIWIILSLLEMSPKSLAAISAKHNVRLTFLFGGIDSIMHPNEASSIKRKIPKATVEILNTGHAGLLRKISEHLNV